MRRAYILFNIHHSYSKKVSFLVTMHSLQECFFTAFIEGNIPGSHNLKYHEKSLKRKIIQLHNITKLLKRPSLCCKFLRLSVLSNQQLLPEQKVISQKLTNFHVNSQIF